MARAGLGGLVGLLALALVGCASAGEDDSPAPAPHAAPLDLSKGRVLPSLVGSWTLRDQVYRLNGDGSYVFHYDREEPAGPGQPPRRSTGDEKGRWTADGTTLYLQGERGIDFKLAYALKGGRLELRAPYAKTADSFVRSRA